MRLDEMHSVVEMTERQCDDVITFSVNGLRYSEDLERNAVL